MYVGALGLPEVILGTLVSLEFEKHSKPFIYSLTMKTTPIHIFEVYKIYIFVYYSVICDPLIY